MGLLYFVLYILSVLATLKIWSIALELDPKPVSHMAFLCFIPITNTIIALVGVLSIMESKRIIPKINDKPLFDW